MTHDVSKATLNLTTTTITTTQVMTTKATTPLVSTQWQQDTSNDNNTSSHDDNTPYKYLNCTSVMFSTTGSTSLLFSTIHPGLPFC